MPAVELVLAKWNFTQTYSFLDGIHQFVADCSLALSVIQLDWSAFVGWLSQPHVYAVILTWAITLTLVAAIALSIGFGPAGVIAGSFAAAFQAWMYGGFTPAAGIFASLTSFGMLGYLVPAVVGFSACVATVAALIVWACGVGH